MAETEKPDLKEQVALLPLSPGVYQFVDRSGTIIYVGKAKSLRKRVASYFVQSKEHSAKVRVLVKQIVEIRHIVVGSETDALLLENSLIKSLQPRYHILLKDDKTYPRIVVRREHFPRVQSTRILTRDGSQYFGPYGSVMMQRSVLDFIREVIPLRTCKLNLAPELIAKDKYTVCLQYHLGNCKAPCVGRQSEEEYAQLVGMVVSVLKGDLRPVRQYLEGEMARAAGELKFELAQRYKQRLDALDNYAGRSVIVSAKIVDVDVFSLLPDDDVAWCNFVRIRHGSIVGVQTVKLSTGIGGDERDMLTLAIQHIVENIAGGELSREVIVPLLPSTTLLFEGVTFTVPKRGEKLELLEFSRKSARIYRAEQLKNLEIKNPERYTERLMNAVQKELRLDRQPRHIECFDNSNLQGAHPVASCVVFRDGKPSRKEYRHFNIKTVVGADDFASMREIVFRRYTRLMAEGQELPDLVIVDGGKGTLEDPGDRRVIGNSSPRYKYGLPLNLSWYGFDLSVFMQGIGRLDWYPGADNLRFWGPYCRPYATFVPKNFMSQVWSESNPDAYLPRARAYTSLNSTQGTAYYTNDRYLQNLAYCRLKNLTLGYTIPKRLTSKVGIKECRVYFSGENLATWSALKNDFLDPEQAAADSDKKSNVYPWCRTYSVGLNLTF